MDRIRKEAREVLQRSPWNRPTVLESALSARLSLAQLWEDVSTHDNSTRLNICESLYAALSFVDLGYDTMLSDDGGPAPLNMADATALSNLLQWASHHARPSSEFAVDFDDHAEIAEDQKIAQEESRLKSEIAVELILILGAKPVNGLQDRSIIKSPGVIATMASFTSKEDPWITQTSMDSAETHINVSCQSGIWPIIERVLREEIRPLFTKTRNPAITSEGRKNLHPMPSAPFDGSKIDDSTKPWKNTDIYATSVLSWAISQYQPTDKAHLEAHFPLLVPAILSLIDDSSITFKAKGCHLLVKLLKPIQESGSDILLRTNLVSVFQEAVTACLLSLPSITPEESSIQILGAAYPALLALLKAAYQPTLNNQKPSQLEKNREAYLTNLTKILRSHLIPSFHHISFSTPASATTSASFPYPRLSTFLLGWISTFCSELKIHTTKYLQDIVPVLYTTLSNPFGTAHLPLLSAAVSTTRAVILNAHPRVWKWRGELLGGLAACWLHVVTDTQSENRKKGKSSGLKRELQSAVFALKHALQNPVSVVGETPDPDQQAAKEGIEDELLALVEADAALEGLLFPKADGFKS
ncbi:hypothetical protein N7532_005097 [Penicillium argentinense]|uniref:Uncharacterized protein n=1 Tax=Penicillium argentinense TaxID=1131581 RepID=A0A9W9FDE6_9EURO|nr:uncharacterized protein N7532_005097 [Penicillium argentinense]KAJ5098096.1 hypothetical protein N7532_005097 [Penicillium argentinense]